MGAADATVALKGQRGKQNEQRQGRRLQRFTLIPSSLKIAPSRESAQRAPTLLRIHSEHVKILVKCSVIEKSTECVTGRERRLREHEKVVSEHRLQRLNERIRTAHLALLSFEFSITEMDLS